MPDRPPDLPAAFELNDRVILGSSPLREFALGKDVPEVQSDVVRRGTEEFRHLPLRKPDSLPLQADIDPHFAVRGLVDDDLAGERVVGGTHARRCCRRSPGHAAIACVLVLVPGIGAQQGEVASLKNFFDDKGHGALVSSSRAIIFPHRFKDKLPWSRESVRRAAEETIADVRKYVPVG